jgi:serine/threonine protein kinase
MIIRNKYQILDRIGIGGMGVVYRGRHLTFNEVCAIKIVNEAIAGDQNFLQRFQTEAVVTRKLRHPNAVRVDDFDYTEDGRPFIVMELVEGKNIGEILQEQGPLRVPRAVRVATQVARALGVAHKLGVVHRDIKPGNIILTTDEQGQETAKVLDFGIAKLREAAGDANPGMTMTGMVVGTPLYMSPEQFMGKKAAGEIDGRTDIYSLGVVLYQMVTAQLPFDGDTPYSLMLQHIQGTVRPPHELAPELHIPESLSQVILKAIDKSRDQRYQTAEELIAALDQVASDQPISQQVTNPAAVINQPPPSQPPPSQVVKAPVSTVAAPRTAPASKVSPTPPKTQPSVAPTVRTTAPAPIPSVSPTVAAPPPSARIATASPASSVLVKSAEQHVLLQPRKFRLKHFLILVVLLLAAGLVAGVGYLKFQTLRRTQIEKAVYDQLSSAPSLTLRQAALRVSVSDKREVTLDGAVTSPDDLQLAVDAAAKVPGVSNVINRVVVAPLTPVKVPVTETPESLISDGNKYLDDGKYDDAIQCFSKAAAADPTNKTAQDLKDRATRAKQTEELLLKNRQ